MVSVQKKKQRQGKGIRFRHGAGGMAQPLGALTDPCSAPSTQGTQLPVIPAPKDPAPSCDLHKHPTTHTHTPHHTPTPTPLK